jgi:hypothetical protein
MPITPAGRVSGGSTFGSMSLDEYVSQELDEFSESEGIRLLILGLLHLMEIQPLKLR